MLQRILPRALPIGNACTACQCRCGRALSRRQYGTRRSAPSTVDEETRLKRRSAAPRASSDAQHGRSAAHYGDLQPHLLHHLLLGNLTANPGRCTSFLKAFDDLVTRTYGDVTPEPGAFKAIMEQDRIDNRTAMNLAIMLRDRTASEERVRGTRLLSTLSRVGYADATLRVLTIAYLQLKTNRTAMARPELRYAKAHMDTLVQKGSKNWRALTLEARIANATGRESYAIETWNRAVDAAVPAFLDRAPLRWMATEEEKREHAYRHGALDPLQLSAPWVDLFNKYYHDRMPRGFAEYSHAEDAARIGCQLDDPTSHYQYSTLVRVLDHNGNTDATSQWLYYVTKAAASGHVLAAHELGLWYANSGWKYISDEPPDHLKPTAFDSYPAAKRPSTGWSAFWTDVLCFLGLKTVVPRDATFDLALFPSTAEQRRIIARQWLERSGLRGYLPSFLAAARIDLDKTLWAQSAASTAALRLTPDRYLYSSQAEWDSKTEHQRQIAQNDQDQTFYSNQEDLPNPSYNPRSAAYVLREIFFGAEAKRYVDAMAIRGVKDMDEDELQSEDRNTHAPDPIRGWLRYPEIRKSYADQMPELLASAKRICDQQGLDLMDHDGGLMYKARLKRGATPMT